ncbi:MAG: replication initiation protein [Leptospira sp.]|nr:replication initiation protein [Leptospira sp.]
MKKISTSIPTIIKNSQPTKKIQKDLPPSVVVFQHNNLIEARYSLTLQEKKIILWLTSQIKPDDKDFKKHMLTVREFMNLMELKGHANYKELQKITLGYTQSNELGETNISEWDYLKVPVLSNFYAGKSGRFHIKIGPHIGYMLQARDVQREFDGDGTNLPTYGGPSDDPNRFMYGITAGAGLSKLFGNV